MKKELFFKNESQISTAKRNLQKAVNSVNQFKQMVFDTLGELDNNQMNELPTNGINIIWSEVRSRYKFPDADDDFNLKALGYDVRPAIDFYKKHKDTWLNFGWLHDKANLIYKDKAYHLAEDQSAINKHFYYIDKPEKKEFLNKVKEYQNLLHFFNDLRVDKNGLYIKNGNLNKEYISKLMQLNYD